MLSMAMNVCIYVRVDHREPMPSSSISFFPARSFRREGFIFSEKRENERVLVFQCCFRKPLFDSIEITSSSCGFVLDRLVTLRTKKDDIRVIIFGIILPQESCVFFFFFIFLWLSLCLELNFLKL